MIGVAVPKNVYNRGTVAGQKNLQIEGNTIPCVLVPLERLFNKNDVASKPMAPKMDEQVVDCNIVSKDKP